MTAITLRRNVRLLLMLGAAMAQVLPCPGALNIETDLILLNKKSILVEQNGGSEAVMFFDALLSSGLIFRRASGKVVGKGGPEGFMENLKNNPFEKRVLE